MILAAILSKQTLLKLHTHMVVIQMDSDNRWDEPTAYLDSALTYLDFVNTLLKAVQFADSVSYTTEILTPQQLAQITDVYKQIKSISLTINDLKSALETPKDTDTIFRRVRAIQQELDSETVKAIKMYESQRSYNDD